MHTMKLLNTYISCVDAERALQKNGGHSKISECCLNKRKTAYGFIWKYLD